MYMDVEWYVLIFLIFVWFVRLEIKVHGLKKGKHYELYQGAYKVLYMGGDGELHFDFNARPMTYKKASGIKKLYPGLKMINKQTGLEEF